MALCHQPCHSPENLRRVFAVRERLGPDFPLMVDANQQRDRLKVLNRPGAIQPGRSQYPKLINTSHADATSAKYPISGAVEVPMPAPPKATRQANIRN